MKRLWIFIFCFGHIPPGMTQQNLLSLHSFYKDKLFETRGEESFSGGSLLPVSEGSYDLTSFIRDSSKQYYDVTEILFKKHLIEVAGKDYAVKISPVIDFALGRDLADTLSRNLFQNTRGAVIYVDLFKNFSFTTAFLENQGRYTRYESDYYLGVGELYPAADKTYQPQNAVIPGAGRTKYFKTDGFDYAYAVGSMSYLPHKKVRISAGNNQSFVGEGHRSILLSDNSCAAPYFRIDYQITEKLSFTYQRAKLMNLLRRPYTSSVESYYEAKGFSMNYLTYHITPKIYLSLFEGGVWNRGDSLTGKFSHPLYYNPVPVLSQIVLVNKNEISGLTGLNIGLNVMTKMRFYGQVAINNLNVDLVAVQLGFRGYNFGKLTNFMVQTEVNTIPSNFYRNQNPRLNYSHYNLPLAHAKGDGFTEVLIRLNYEWKRVYIEQAAHYYFLDNHSDRSHLAIYGTFERSSGTVLISTTELGYRFNRKMNLSLFGSFTYRQASDPWNSVTQFAQFGLKTGLFNHYRDF